MKEIVKPAPAAAIKEQKPFFHHGNRDQAAPFFPGALQMKSEVNPSGDIFELEADRVASRVTQQANAQNEDPVKAVGKQYGIDLGEVNIHTGEEPAQMNRELNSKAFTVGRDIYFNENRYQPETTAGKQLLAHELAHVAQQATGKVPGKAVQRNGQTQDIANISTPVPAGLQPNDQGEVHTTINGVNIHIRPDRTLRTKGTGGDTSFSTSGGSIRIRRQSGGRVTSFSGPSQITVTIRTSYQRSADPSAPSAYGAGPSLREHEGSHGTDYLNYITNNQPPVFDGTDGMTTREFNAKVREYRSALRQYFRDMGAESVQLTDCTGSTTIDDATGSNVCTP